MAGDGEHKAAKIAGKALETRPSTAPPQAKPTVGQTFGPTVGGLVDRHGAVGVYLASGGLGLVAALTSGAVAAVFLVLALVAGALGVAYNKRETANYAAMESERDQAVLRRAAAERSAKAAIRHEAATRTMALELAMEALAEVVGCDSHDRVTLFRLRPGDPPRLVAVKRIARNPAHENYQPLKLFGVNEGFIGSALTDGHVLCANLPDPGDAEAYVAAHVACGLTDAAARGLSMMARSYFGLAVEAPGVRHQFVGVLMFESLDPDRWLDQEEHVPELRERVKVSLGYLIMEAEPGEDEPGEDAKEVYP